MSQYDFTTYVDRRGTSSTKWDGGKNITGKTGLLPFWVADMDFPIAPEIVDALSSRLSHRVFGYTSRPESLDDALIGWFSRRHGWKIAREHILEIPGMVPFLHIAVQGLTDKGDGVIIQEPVYYPFSRAVKLNDRVIADNPLRCSGPGTWSMDIPELEKTIKTTGARLLVLCSPHNPVGRVWSRPELLALADLCREHNVMVIADEIHADLVFPPFKQTPWLTLPADRLPPSIVLLSANKTFNLPGLNTAFAIVPDPDIRKRATDILTGLGFGGGSSAPMSYTATEAAWRHGEQWLEELIVHLVSNDTLLRRHLAEYLPKILPSPLEGTYLEWLFLGDRLRDETAAWQCLLDHGVWLSNGRQFGFGGEGHLRMNIACPQTLLSQGLEHMSRALHP